MLPVEIEAEKDMEKGGRGRKRDGWHEQGRQTLPSKRTSVVNGIATQSRRIIPPSLAGDTIRMTKLVCLHSDNHTITIKHFP